MHSVSLRYFLAVANTGSLGEASEKLHVTISAISRQIAKLEDEVGYPLFERQPRGMALTKAGELLAAHVRRTLLEGEQVLDEINALASFDRSTIRIASSEAFARDILPRAIARYLEKSPGTRFELSVTAPQDVTLRVCNGDADIGLTFSVLRDPEICVEYTRSSPIYALMRRNHDLAARSKVSLSDLQHFPIALLDPGTTIRQMFDMASSFDGLLFDPVLTCNNSSTLHVFTQISGAVSLTSRFAVRAQLTKDGLVAIPIDHPAMALRSVQIQTLSGRMLSATLKGFLAQLIELLEVE
ncbi:LysR family transcriptional regulator [Paraburkholderia caffeinilytica]|uniref:LysR family transcriptional regulator n=1 Tax=Paraburkholderia caffeinilytica TaxID=1761016 RepID=A0ABQ1MWZ0_9BURK|nr:LysR family transcriptional regulator [Paraburkholderia caffeinilytica]AXL49327.1 LysR family transcriptional regulator [Paraburkholderia caffeinilytica]GGC48243.1 LysR family transcriptional regulator [Paraburkholderia caffeinilytica]CAB3782557.1 HTH-type transcriptional regulator GltC [Paraburkholderia caffeinilytica]